MKRISRGTPYVLTTSDIENILASITPRMEENIAALLDITVAQWRKLPKAQRAKHLVDFQNRGVAAATLVAAAKAQNDLDELAHRATEPAASTDLASRIARIEAMLTPKDGVA